MKKNIITTLLIGLTGVVLLTGCGSLGKGMTDSASAKNLNADGYLMYGVVETNNPETATPQGKMLFGRVSYKSRKVGIPADQKVPTTGYFKATKTKNLFGTEEAIIEYDFTAGSDAEAERAFKQLEANRKEATAAMAAEGRQEQATAPAKAAAELVQSAADTPVPPASAAK